MLSLSAVQETLCFLSDQKLTTQRNLRIRENPSRLDLVPSHTFLSLSLSVSEDAAGLHGTTKSPEK